MPHIFHHIMYDGERIKDKIREAYSDQKNLVLLGILPNAELISAGIHGRNNKT